MSQPSYRQALLASCVLAATVLAGPAMAQTAPESVNQTTVEPGIDEGASIVVTGTRIARPELASPNPITTIDDESILRSGETNLVDYLQQVPALVGSVDSSQTSGSAGFIGSTGLNLLNLRNLGVERTLVLVDGRRHVAQLPETAAVDIGTIPQDLIQRIDVATGGVSAVYGADAVSGVVNFIMKKDFEGLVGRVQSGVGSRGEPMNWTASLVGGKNFANDRGNISLAYQFTHEGRLESRDRKYLRGANYCTLQRNPADPVDDPNIPDEVPLCGVQFFDSTAEGAFDVDWDFFPDFRPNGDPYNSGEFIPPFYSVGGIGTFRGDYIGDLLARNDRHVINAFVNYEVNDRANFFAEIKYAHGKAFSLSQPTFDYSVLLSAENPFMPQALRDQVIPGMGVFFEELLGFFGLPTGPMPDGVLLGRDNFDLGVRGERNKRETWRGVVGFNGELSDDIRYDLSYVYGQSKIRSVSTNNRFNDRYFAALDVVSHPVTGQPVCRSNLDPAALQDQFLYNFVQAPFLYSNLSQLSFTPGPNSGCQPLNLFGNGVASPAAIDWVMTDSLATSKLTQNVLNGFVSGSVPGFELPGGPVGFVLGGEWRKETSRSTPPIEDTLGQTFGNIIFPVNGDFNVKEAFGEVRLPLLRRQPFFYELEANGALRISDYSTVGGTTTWNVGARWAPVRDLAFRGTYAQAVRAPNIAELFSPESQTFEFIDDPCDIENVNNGSATRVANCAAILNSLGIDPTNFEDPNSSSVPGFSRGNDSLLEETAKSWTVGAVARPSFIPGLSVTVDWYDIKIEDAINTAEPEEVAELCVDQPSFENVFCDAIIRSPVTGGISDFIIQPENVANFRTAGLDFNVNYQLDPARLGMSNIGMFNFRLLGNYLDRLEFISTPGAELDNDRTEQYAPKWQATVDVTWQLKPVTVNYGFNYFSKTKRYSNADLEGDPDLASEENINFDARHTHDVQVAFDVQDRFRFYVGVNNLTDQKPDLSTSYPVNAIGRFFYAGARMRFDQLR